MYSIALKRTLRCRLADCSVYTVRLHSRTAKPHHSTIVQTVPRSPVSMWELRTECHQSKSLSQSVRLAQVRRKQAHMASDGTHRHLGKSLQGHPTAMRQTDSSV